VSSTPETQTEVFVVSKDETIRRFLPEDIQYRFVSHYSCSGDFAAKMSRAKQLLEEYRSRARLIVTTLLHCALPAIAMGIPVVAFYPPNSEAGHASDRERFSSLEKLLRVYHIDEMGEVDWNPRTIDVGAIKLQLLDRFYAMAAARWRLAPLPAIGPVAPPHVLPGP
jgi:hypothetical protein